jgi:hypothetical protein
MRSGGEVLGKILDDVVCGTASLARGYPTPPVLELFSQSRKSSHEFLRVLKMSSVAPVFC